ncbi:MAG: hypothetical protein JWM74_4158 [Myxococcaceae bacterium]|nr:hypothetical protein [Myxococcaceae bacterium]
MTSLREELEGIKAQLEPEPPPAWVDNVDAVPPVEPVNLRNKEFFERGDHVELAIAHVEQLGPEDEVVYDDGTMCTYDGARGLFQHRTACEESRLVQSFAGMLVGTKEKPKVLDLKASDVSGAIRLAHDRVARPGFFSFAPAGLAFADGFVEARDSGITVRPHSPMNRARYGYPFAFGDASAPTRFLAFMGDLFAEDADAASKVAFLQEFCGASLLGIAPKYQRCVVLTGEGANGKSTFINTISSVMPPGATSAIAPQTWDNEYRRAMLAGKRLNLVSELPEADILSSEAFKAIVSGDPIVGREIRQSPFTFTPMAGHLFAANRLPGSTDTSHGFWRRFVVIAFNRRFEGANANADLAQEIISSERAGIARWMLDGAVRVQRQRAYTLPASSAEAVATWQRSANPVALFLDECTVAASAGDGTSASQVYGHYRGWCERNGHRAVSTTKFGMRMRELDLSSTHTKSGARYPVLVTGGDGLVTGYGPTRHHSTSWSQS